MQSDVEDAVDQGFQDTYDMSVDNDDQLEDEEEQQRPVSKKARLEKGNLKPNKPLAPRERQEVMHLTRTYPLVSLPRS